MSTRTRMMTAVTNRIGMLILLNHSIPLLTPRYSSQKLANTASKKKMSSVLSPLMKTAPSILDYLNDASKAYFDKVQSVNSKESGNGRLARNIIEEAILRQSKRIVEQKSKELDILKSEDFKL